VAEVRRTFPHPPAAVYAVLADPSAYPRWVVGAQRLRGVEGTWPEPGATFHHVVGVWPLRLRDSTTAIEAVTDRRLVLEARARPMGRARVELELLPDPEGGTVVVMREDAVAGPGRIVPDAVLQPSIRRRNEVALRRLEREVSRRQA
jgi:uncharacterized protein YndB with AHSA1/START domain